MPENCLITNLKASAYRIPTDGPEVDGTLQWDSTTLVWVELQACGLKGIGYTYAHEAAAFYIEHKLKKIILGRDVMNIPEVWQAMTTAVRNDGWGGLTCMAISAIDSALWDLKAKILNKPLAVLLGQVRTDMAIYGSGGFISYNDTKLQQQFTAWLEQGIKAVKMKVGRNASEDERRIQTALNVIGNAELMVDANGAYNTGTAIEMAVTFANYGVRWYEEPVPYYNLSDLNFVREKAPPAINIASGEYANTPWQFADMITQRTVDILQADATRCCGITGFLKAAQLCESYHLPFSSHCAPAVHLHAGVSLPAFTIAEYFHDHVRIENMLFDGAPQPQNGVLKPDLTRPGIGIELKHADALPYQIL